MARGREFTDRESQSKNIGFSTGKPNSKTKPPLGLTFVNGTCQGFSVNTESKKILTQNKLRAYLLIQNKSAAIVYVSIGTAIDDNNFNAFEIAPGGNFEPNTNGQFVIASEIYVKGAVGSQNIVVAEGLFIKA